MNVNLGFSTGRDIGRDKVTYIWISLNPPTLGLILGGVGIMLIYDFLEPYDKCSLKARGKRKVQKKWTCVHDL